MQDWFKRFKKGLFTKTQVLVGITLTMLITSALIYAYQVLSLTTFSSGTTISSAEVNQNFSLINDKLTELSYRWEVKFSNNVTLNSVGGCCNYYTLFQVINFDQVSKDENPYQEGNDFINDGNLTIDEEGFYQIFYTMKAINGGTAGANIYFFKNASTQYFQNFYANASVNSVYNGQYTKYFNAGDVIEVRGNAACCGSSTVDIDASETRFYFKKL
jgi:hypothetical protein